MALNEKLLEVLGDDVTADQGFAHVNDVLKNAVGASLQGCWAGKGVPAGTQARRSSSRIALRTMPSRLSA